MARHSKCQSEQSAFNPIISLWYLNGDSRRFALTSFKVWHIFDLFEQYPGVLTNIEIQVFLNSTHLSSLKPIMSPK